MMVSMSAREELREVRREGLLSDLRDPLTWRTALYVLLAFPAGVLVMGLLSAGTVLGVLSLPLLFGAALLLGALWLVGGLADVQRFLARLLGLHLARPALSPAYTGVLPWLRGVLSDAATYRALLFHVAQLPLALLCWAVLAALLTLALAGLSAPLWLGQPHIPLTWKGAAIQTGTLARAGAGVAGLGALLLLGGVLNLMRRVWTRLVLALLSPDQEGAARREVVALRRAAGRIALGDDLQATLQEIVRQARAASTAQTVLLLSPVGLPRAGSGHESPLATAPASALAPGEVRVWAEGGVTLADLTLPAGAEGGSGGTLRAIYPPGLRPSGDELAFLASMADHAATALQAADLIERASLRAGEQERARLARELHDSVAQALYGISLGAKTARATLDKDAARARASLDYTIRLAEGGVSEMKALLFSLRPDALEEGGLVAALSQHAHALEARHGLKVHATLNAEPPLSAEAQAAAYRIAQEALHNVVKHARASQVWLSLREEGGQVRLTVRDDGRGFDPQAQGRGTLGQRSMRERAAGVGGSLSVESGAGGTKVTLRLPAQTETP